MTSESDRRAARSWLTCVDGRQLRELRPSRGMSAVRLAIGAGLHESTVRRIETEPSPWCRPRTVRGLADVLGVAPEVLLGKTRRGVW